MTETILVTGGSGLVGRAVKFAVDEWSIESAARITDGKTITFNGRVEGKPADFNFVFLSSKDGDLRDLKDADTLFNTHRPSRVIHLAARVGGLFANMNDQIGFLRDNLKINDNVTSCCHKYKVKRAIFCLSTCVYPAKIELPYSEEDIHKGPPHTTNEGYAHAKRILECLVRYYRDSLKKEWICIIPTNLYGPHDNFKQDDSHVIPGLIHKAYLSAQKGEPFVVAGSGSPYRQFLYSLDAGRIILALLRAKPGVLKFSSIILAPDVQLEYTIKYVAEAIAKRLGVRNEIIWDTSKSDGVRRKTALNLRLRSLVGDKYEFTDFERGLSETCEWFIKNYDNVSSDDSIRK